MPTHEPHVSLRGPDISAAIRGHTAPLVQYHETDLSVGIRGESQPWLQFLMPAEVADPSELPADPRTVVLDVNGLGTILVSEGGAGAAHTPTMMHVLRPEDMESVQAQIDQRSSWAPLPLSDPFAQIPEDYERNTYPAALKVEQGGEVLEVGETVYWEWEGGVYSGEVRRVEPVIVENVTAEEPGNALEVDHLYGVGSFLLIEMLS